MSKSLMLEQALGPLQHKNWNYMSNRSRKSANKKKLSKNHQPTESVKEIEYYINNNGNDTQIIRNIAVSSLIPIVGSDKKNEPKDDYSLLGELYFNSLEDRLFEKKGIDSVWSFTMMVKDSGDHKLLFSSQEDAEQFYTEILKN